MITRVIMKITWLAKVSNKTHSALIAQMRRDVTIRRIMFLPHHAPASTYYHLQSLH